MGLRWVQHLHRHISHSAYINHTGWNAAVVRDRRTFQRRTLFMLKLQ